MARAASALHIAHFRLVADVGFISHDLGTVAAHNVQSTIAHCFTDAVSKEPCRLVGDFQNAVQLVSRNALLAAGHQIDGL